MTRSDGVGPRQRRAQHLSDTKHPASLRGVSSQSGYAVFFGRLPLMSIEKLFHSAETACGGLRVFPRWSPVRREAALSVGSWCSVYWLIISTFTGGDQYSSGRRMVVTDRSHSVMIQSFSPLAVW